MNTCPQKMIVPRQAFCDLEEIVCEIERWTAVAYLAAGGLSNSAEREAFRELCAEIERKAVCLSRNYYSAMEQAAIGEAAPCA